ncbi:dNTP triphosphohydrolase [Mesobacillus maritimus]|uniref:deoxyguanosinetriphosphate triphosphohydrolase family protein n=1 Tax=Mesobacillus maritimus TaxID=1643336 RepID=UPI002041D892|nr:dNTP triphosphohydrolase [Mesobacillus maritimus]MCM3585013.1 dNTP triphosphohydrolase [Mesobacillus maritimus]
MKIQEFSTEKIQKLRDFRIHDVDSTRKNEKRNEFQRDYGRLIHSPSFRRLHGKSQVFGAGSGDYYRNRLTHTLEVAQIARVISTFLLNQTENLPKNPGLVIDPLVVESASLAHDIGHPPFGHKGEHDLNKLLQQYGEFYEGNAQNFRILMYLENIYPDHFGLNLTAAVLLGINKYPYRLKDNGKKGLYDSEWEQISALREEWNIPNKCRTLEAQIMDLADDIAYSTHDIEDGIKAGKIRRDSIFYNHIIDELIMEICDSKDIELWDGLDKDEMKEDIISLLTEYLNVWEDKVNCSNEVIGRQELKAHYVNEFANSVGIIKVNVDGNDWYKVTFTKDGKEDISLMRLMIVLKRLVWVTLVKDIRVQRLQMRGEIIIKGLWEVFKDQESGKKILPKGWLERYDEDETWNWERFIVDYISGMTDNYADKIYSELYGSRVGNIYGE